MKVALSETPKTGFLATRPNYDLVHYEARSDISIRINSVSPKIKNYSWVHLYTKADVFLDFLVTVKAAPHECVITTGQP